MERHPKDRTTFVIEVRESPVVHNSWKVATVVNGGLRRQNARRTIPLLSWVTGGSFWLLKAFPIYWLRQLISPPLHFT